MVSPPAMSARTRRAHSTATGLLTFTYSTQPDLSGGAHLPALVTDPLRPVTVSLTGLAPGLTYYYQATNALGAVAGGRFRTPAAVGSHTGLSFGVSGDWRGELSPYPALSNVASKNLDFFVELGDTIYADYPSPAVPVVPAVTLEQFRLKNNEVYAGRFGLNNWADIRSSTAILATIDDHEVLNDFWGGGSAASDPRFPETSGFINDTRQYENGLQAFQEYNPLVAEFYGNVDDGNGRMDGERKLYRYRTFGSEAAIILLDSRSFRDRPIPAVDFSRGLGDVFRFLIEAFTPGRTMLGRQQLTDLKNDLLLAQQQGLAWKFVLVPEPIQNLSPFAADDRFEGYAAERAEILKFINDNNISNVVFVAADIHGTMVNNLTYQTGPGRPQIPTTAFEITTGSVAFDAPFGPTVVNVGVQAGLISPELKDFYDNLPIASDPDSVVDDKDDFVKSYSNALLGQFNYNPVGLQGSPVDALLLQGDYIAVHTFGWTEFSINPATRALLVTTYGITPYTEDELLAAPNDIITRQPAIVSQFIVNPPRLYVPVVFR